MNLKINANNVPIRPSCIVINVSQNVLKEALFRIRCVKIASKTALNVILKAVLGATPLSYYTKGNVLKNALKVPF